MVSPGGGTLLTRHDVHAAREQRVHGFRGDVDGLRAVAILLIVAFHAGLPFFEGGFVGVDVFFVISGFLITRNLLRDDTVRPLRFWARRIRRLVPALSVMVVFTMAASAVILPSFEIEQVAKEGAASALYVSNILFARASQDYFAAEVSESPFLHTWSLGVEEQFYLVWPLLFAGCVWLAGRVARRQHLGRVLTISYLIVLAGSFLLNLRLTDQGSTWAFFSLPTRAWEFAAAGLLAVLSSRLVIRSLAARTLLGVAGLLLVGIAAVAFTAETPYPGVAALLPVVGTMLAILGGSSGADSSSATSPVTGGLATAPMQWIGRVSYSWYLWHWPFIVLAVSAFDDRVRYRVTAALVSLPVAYLTYRLVENPIRFSPRLTTSVRKTYALGAVATFVALSITFGAAYAKTGWSATTLDAQLAAATQREKGCTNTRTPSGIAFCEGGDVTSDTVVLFTGDSHGLVWTDAMGRAAQELGVRLVSRILPGCPPIPLEVEPRRQGVGEAEACNEKHEDDKRLTEELRPAAVVLAMYDGYTDFIKDTDGRVPDKARQVELWREAYRSFIHDVRAQGPALGILLDNPELESAPNKCIARARRIEPCVPSRAEALVEGKALREAGRAVIDEVGDVPTLDLIDLVCDAEVCRLSMDDVLVYEDTNHLSHGATLLLQDEVRGLLARTLGL